MTNRLSPAFLASCGLHVMLAFFIIGFVRLPAERMRNVLPDVPLLTLVRPPPAPAIETAPKPKPAAVKPKPPPEPVNLTPAAEPVPEPVPEPVAPLATTGAPVMDAGDVPAGPVVVPAPAPIDPVYPVSRLKDGLVPLVRTEVPYPLIAQDRGIEGSVDAQFVVDKTGNVEDIWIAHSSHKFFSDAVLKNVRKWRFKTPMIDGKAARVKANQHFEFRLE